VDLLTIISVLLFLDQQRDTVTITGCSDDGVGGSWQSGGTA
jgi:hypothetical protein